MGILDLLFIAKRCSDHILFGRIAHVLFIADDQRYIAEHIVDPAGKAVSRRLILSHYNKTLRIFRLESYLTLYMVFYHYGFLRLFYPDSKWIFIVDNEFCRQIYACIVISVCFFVIFGFFSLFFKPLFRAKTVKRLGFVQKLQSHCRMKTEILALVDNLRVTDAKKLQNTKRLLVFVLYVSLFVHILYANDQIFASLF